MDLGRLYVLVYVNRLLTRCYGYSSYRLSSQYYSKRIIYKQLEVELKIKKNWKSKDNYSRKGRKTYQQIFTKRPRRVFLGGEVDALGI